MFNSEKKDAVVQVRCTPQKNHTGIYLEYSVAILVIEECNSRLLTKIV